MHCLIASNIRAPARTVIVDFDITPPMTQRDLEQQQILYWSIHLQPYLLQKSDSEASRLGTAPSVPQ